MKRLALLSILFFFIGIFSLPAQSFEMLNGDTINLIDANRKRQGKWLIKASPNDAGYKKGELVEEGVYKDSRKIGIWKKYYPGGKIKSEITYSGGRPKGPYTLYYDNGNIEESGNWQRTKNTGSFKRYHPNGKVAQDFTFSETGKRTGKQTYYYENGNVRLEGTWQEGLESGEMKEYYENGDLMEVKQFNNGALDKTTIESYAPKTPQMSAEKKLVAEGKDIEVKVEAGDQPNQGTFDGNGYKKLFNANKQIAKDGIFKRYRLMDGKQYVYDDNGLLIQIMIFKEGKYVGDGVIEQD